MGKFVPESEREKDKEEKVPYIEDVKSEDGIAGHATKRSIEELKSLCRQAMGKIGGAIIRFQTGRIEGLWENRPAYMVYFNYYGKPGRIKVTGLPSRTGRANWVRQSRKHALYTLWKRFENLYNFRHVFPDDLPLVGYTLGWEGIEGTLVEEIQRTGELPALGAGKPDDVQEGYFTEIEEGE